MKKKKTVKKPRAAPAVVDHTAHEPGDECLLCGFGLDICPACGVQNLSRRTRVCGGCGAKARRRKTTRAV